MIATYTWEHGSHSLYRLNVRGQDVAVFHPGVGAPPAAGLLEQVIATGCQAFVACGGAGALVPLTNVGQRPLLRQAELRHRLRRVS